MSTVLPSEGSAPRHLWCLRFGYPFIPSVSANPSFAKNNNFGMSYFVIPKSSPIKSGSLSACVRVGSWEGRARGRLPPGAAVRGRHDTGPRPPRLARLGTAPSQSRRGGPGAGEARRPRRLPVMAAAASPPRGFCRSVHWFRRGLRLHDNPALQAALRGAASLRCIYILDPWFAASSAVGINRWR